MSNYTDFFGVGAGGGGGFTNMKKISTFRSDDNTTDKQGPDISPAKTNQNKTTGATTMQFQSGFGSPANNTFTNVVDSMAGYTFEHNSTTHTVTANPAFTWGYDVVFTFTPGLTANLNYNTSINFTIPSITINPATDLGLEDGASIGIFMISGGTSSTNSTNAGNGGRILQQTKIISNASTNLILTIGTGGTTGTNNSGSDSTISGGLTLTTADGYDGAGVGHNITSKMTLLGINGYGIGGRTQTDRGGASGEHGWGNGNYFGGVGGDGAILLFY